MTGLIDNYIIKMTHIPFNDISYVINRKKCIEDKNDDRVKRFNSKRKAKFYCLLLRLYHIKSYKYYKFEVIERIKYRVRLKTNNWLEEK